ncbi:MAG: NAD(P)/FAD-dependent oxidoreductase [Acidimicrobiaceae bacterium]|nr:NAD(P)/FAD-dependent oxidoreductase [Acidimicrobiaceae bacterium]
MAERTLDVALDPFDEPVTEMVDVVVIGLGPGGEYVANELLSRGLRVVAIESELMGGECADWGCVPTKMMVRAANLLAEAGRVSEMAGSATVTPDWKPVATRIREEATHSWNDNELVVEFERKGGRFIRGTARLVDGADRSLDRWDFESGAIGSDGGDSALSHDVEVGGRRFSPRFGVVIATGARNMVPDVTGLAGLPYWNNRDIVQLEQLPNSLAILGGGAIAVELGQLLARFGVAVTIVEVAERLLASEEPEASRLLEGVLRAEGIEVITRASVELVTHDSHGFSLDLGPLGRIRADQLLVATGRRPDLQGLGVEVIGIDPKLPELCTDENMRVAPGVWAVGDVTGHGSFTHVATYQGHIAVSDITGSDHARADYRAVPRVVYTDPEIGAVGLSEQSARASGLRVRIGQAPMPTEARGWIHKVGNEGLIKLVEDCDRGVLVGALSIGPCGGEVLAVLTLAIHAEVPVSNLKTMLYAYPTFHRAIEAALADLH